jgi:hypothetical protein
MSARQKAWLERREVERRARILRRSRVVKWLSAIVVLALGAGAFQYLRKGKAGDECHAASDCRSDMCKTARGIGEDFELKQKSQCSKACEIDDDCPGTMDCRGRVCIPTFKPDREP